MVPCSPRSGEDPPEKPKNGFGVEATSLEDELEDVVPVEVPWKSCSTPAAAPPPRAAAAAEEAAAEELVPFVFSCFPPPGPLLPLPLMTGGVDDAGAGVVPSTLFHTDEVVVVVPPD